MKPIDRNSIRNLMKNANDLKKDLNKVKSHLKDNIISCSSGGGKVKVALNGHNFVESIEIDKEIVDKDNVMVLQDLILSAINEAVKQIREHNESELSKYTGRFNIPKVVSDD